MPVLLDQPFLLVALNINLLHRTDEDEFHCFFFSNYHLVFGVLGAAALNKLRCGDTKAMLAKTTPPINPTVLFIVPHGCLCSLPAEKQHVHNRPFSYSNGLSSKRFLHAYIPQDGHIDRFRQGKNRR